MELELKAYFRILLKRWWLILSLVILFCGITGVYSYYYAEPVYQASTKIIVNQSAEGYVGNIPDYNVIRTNLTLVETYKEIIKTPAIMDKVVENHPEFNMTAEQLIQKVRVNSVNDTQVMTLIVRDSSYEKAAQMVNAISETFREEIPNIMNIDNVMILNYAKPDKAASPVEPKPVLNLVISFVVALMLGTGLAFLLEYLDDTIKTEADVEQVLGLPTLAMILKIRDEDVKMEPGTTKEKQIPQVGENTYAKLNQQRSADHAP